MPTVAENLLTVISNSLGADWHVGETVPDGETLPLAYVRQSGELETECLDDGAGDVDNQAFDVELVAANIQTLRTKADALKTALRALRDWPASLGGSVQFVSVEDHSADYVPAVERNENEEIETFAITLHY